MVKTRGNTPILPLVKIANSIFKFIFLVKTKVQSVLKSLTADLIKNHAECSQFESEPSRNTW